MFLMQVPYHKYSVQKNKARPSWALLIFSTIIVRLSTFPEEYNYYFTLTIISTSQEEFKGS